MTREFLLRKSPDGLTAEERLFNVGSHCAKLNTTVTGTLIGIGLSSALFGLFIFGMDTDFFEIACVSWVLGGLLFSIGMFLFSIYLYGLHCLERAELLYNTRLAYEYLAHTTTNAPIQKSEQPVPQPTQVQQPEQTIRPIHHRPQQPVTEYSTWVCSCGAQNKGQYGQCKSCGKQRGDEGVVIQSNQIVSPKEEKIAGAPPIQQTWKCPNCGTENPAKYGQCKSCGTFRT